MVVDAILETESDGDEWKCEQTAMITSAKVKLVTVFGQILVHVVETRTVLFSYLEGNFSQ